MLAARLLRRSGRSLPLLSQPFSTTPRLSKKPPRKPSPPDTTPPPDPLDQTSLQAGIADALTSLHDRLAKLSPAGTLDIAALAALRVQPQKGVPHFASLHDLAQIVPKGRVVQVLVGEAEHVKPIAAAMHTSALTPQPDPSGQNAQLLVLPVPPRTAESRREAAGRAAQAGEAAARAIAQARSRLNKALRELQVGRRARPDELVKAQAGMEKTVEEAQKRARRAVEERKRVLERD